MLQHIDAADVARRLSYPALVDVLAEAFKGGITAPPRHHHEIERQAAPDATLLLMPAWRMRADGGSYLGLKSVTVFPDNATRGLPSVLGLYVLFDGASGAPLATIDGRALTVWRTAAASALAARHLARPDARVHAMIGAGDLAPYLVRAHASVRPIEEVRLWNRTRARAERTIAKIEEAQPGLRVSFVADLEQAVRGADIVSTATLSREPLVRGLWLAAGTHLDCVGAFNAHMRETDDEAVARARLFADTKAGAFGEAGDILQPLAAGRISREHVKGDLFDLAAGRMAGRTGAGEITMFKSVGASLEDLAAAIAVYEAGVGA